MKSKQLTVVVLSALMAATVSASEVKMYGIADIGVDVQHRSYVDGTSANVTGLKSGQNLNSRFGITGEEDIGHGFKVGFALENGFNVDTGTMNQNNRLFGREARVYVDGPWGYLSLGRMGPVIGGSGPYARFGRDVNPFSCAWGDMGGTLQNVALGYDFVDNAIAYTTPKFGDVDATFQYSFGSDSTKFGTGTEGSSSVERMYAGAIRYQTNRMMLAAGIESINRAQPAARTNDLDDSYSYNLGANFDAGWAKFYAYAQYFENYTAASKTTMMVVASGIDGYGGTLGIEVPMMGGSFLASVGHGNFEGSKDSSLTLKTYQIAVGYLYPLSKRTSIYTSADWIRSDFSDAYKATHAQALKGVSEFTIGVTHRF